MELINFKELKEILQKKKDIEEKIEKKVFGIIEKVKKEGDKSIIYFTKKFDGIKLESIKVKKEEFEKAKEILTNEEKILINETIKRIKKYHEKQMPKSFVLIEKGCKIQFKFSPIEKIGIYIPSGQYPLISTILMSVIPAKVAGVKEIFIATAPSKNSVNPYILAISSLLGIKDVFSVGGAQAIAGFAYGTETIPKVDKIVGPGNKYVNIAKKLLYGKIGIDLLAGPSEVVIFSDETGKEKFITVDLLAQMEHTDGFGFLITTSKKLGEKVSSQVKTGYWMYVKDINSAVEIINYIAPEHLQIICKNPYDIAKQVIAGAVFINNYSPVAAGDYFIGPSHILPTGTSAKFSSGLSVYSFLRSYAIIETNKSFLEKYGKYIIALADIEGLKFHSQSIKIRKAV